MLVASVIIYNKMMIYVEANAFNIGNDTNNNICEQRKVEKL